MNKFSIFYKIDFLGIRRRIINQLMKYVFLFKKLMINVIPFVRNMSELKFTYKIPSFCVHKKVSLVNIIYIQVFSVCEVCLVWKLTFIKFNLLLRKVLYGEKILKISLNCKICYFADIRGYISFCFSAIVGLYPGI